MGQEIEAKFYVQHPEELERRVKALGGRASEGRVYEKNLRFDTPGRDLKRAGRVLRLRQDNSRRITYKEGNSLEGGALSRREVEFAVSDFDAAQEFIEALGYEVAFIYEKYRTTYKMNDIEIMVDEMPYGNFVELEGEAGALKPSAQNLGLDWSASIPESYSALFDHLAERLHLDFRDLTFDNFQGLQIRASDLGVQAADS
ncbi:MAG: class IV adenylate cyclase [Anaerolineales bacterium]